MSLVTQILMICAVSLGLAGTLVGLRGLPREAPTVQSEGVCTGPAEGAAVTPWVSLEAAHAEFGDPGVLFIDCRPSEQFETGHIAGALSLRSETEQISAPWLAILRGARTVITYCDAAGGCASSVRLAERLRQAGVADARILKGGLPAWLAHGYPAESGVCPLCPSQSEP